MTPQAQKDFKTAKQMALAFSALPNATVSRVYQMTSSLRRAFTERKNNPFMLQSALKHTSSALAFLYVNAS